jgi:predicted cupin superfamily sugar epimerase
MRQEAETLIKRLDLKKHPEGGYYNEIYRSEEKNNSGKRNLAASIYFLLPKKEFSAFHRIKQDEIWYFHQGENLIIHVLDPIKGYYSHNLGIKKNSYPQVIIRGGCWFAAELNGKGSFSLVGCMTTPAFDFADFEIAEKNKLIQEHPDNEELISRLTIR